MKDHSTIVSKLILEEEKQLLVFPKYTNFDKILVLSGEKGMQVYELKLVL